MIDAKHPNIAAQGDFFEETPAERKRRKTRERQRQYRERQKQAGRTQQWSAPLTSDEMFHLERVLAHLRRGEVPAMMRDTGGKYVAYDG